MNFIWGSTRALPFSCCTVPELCPCQLETLQGRHRVVLEQSIPVGALLRPLRVPRGWRGSGDGRGDSGAEVCSTVSAEPAEHPSLLGSAWADALGRVGGSLALGTLGPRVPAEV